MITGIDISNNNPGVNMAQARAQGVGFVIAKASQGWTGGPGGWLDWTFVDIVNRARAAGIIPGAYHWLLRGNGAAQAQTFLASLQRVGGPAGLVCGVDVEENSWNRTLDPDAQTLADFYAEWDRLTGQPCAYYGAPWYHNRPTPAQTGGAIGWGLGGTAQFANRPLWVAQYTGVGPGAIADQVASVTPGYFTPFGGWTSYTFRQFTDNAQVGGLEVDANVTYLAPAQLAALTKKGSDVAVTLSDQQYTNIMTTLQQLVTIIEGVPAGKPNPFGLVGFRDIDRRLKALEQKQGIAA